MSKNILKSMMVFLFVFVSDHTYAQDSVDLSASGQDIAPISLAGPSEQTVMDTGGFDFGHYCLSSDRRISMRMAYNHSWNDSLKRLIQSYQEAPQSITHPPTSFARAQPYIIQSLSDGLTSFEGEWMEDVMGKISLASGPFTLIILTPHPDMTPDNIQRILTYARQLNLTWVSSEHLFLPLCAPIPTILRHPSSGHMEPDQGSYLMRDGERYRIDTGSSGEVRMVRERQPLRYNNTRLRRAHGEERASTVLGQGVLQRVYQNESRMPEENDAPESAQGVSGSQVADLTQEPHRGLSPQVLPQSSALPSASPSTSSAFANEGRIQMSPEDLQRFLNRQD